MGGGWSWCAAQRRGRAGILAVLQQDRFHMGVVLEDADQFHTAIASIPDDADRSPHD